MSTRPLPDLTPLDPAHRTDRLGSPAARALLERIVATPRTSEPARVPARPATRRSRRLASALLASSAAAALVVGVGAVVLTQGDNGGPLPGGVPSASVQTAPVQLVLAAARTTAEVTSLRFSGSWTSGDLNGRFTGEVDGQRARQVITYAGGDTATYVQDGTDQWYLADGIVARETTGSLAPFPQSAAAVVTAVTGLGSVQDLGTDTVSGQPAQHYQVAVSDAERAALAALPLAERTWFGLEDTGEVSELDVWVADGLIVKTAVQGALYPQDRSEVEFMDFGAKIVIDVPTQESEPES